MPPSCQLLSGSLPTSRIAFPMTSTAQRGFSSSSTLYRNHLVGRRGGDLGKHEPKYVIPQDAKIPEYPYGPNLLYKQSNRGLYGGQRIQFGNNVSKKTETKTRRFWKPNVLNKGLYSVALKKKINLRVTSKVLKIIDKEGGLDNYLLKPSEARIKELGPLGWSLRWTLLQRPEIIERMRAEAAALGVSQEIIDRQWPAPIPRSRAQQEADELSVLNAVEEANSKEIDLEAIAQEAWEEYGKALKAAKRYVERKAVDTLEDGIKLAFVREKDRKYYSDRNQQQAQELEASEPEAQAALKARNKAARQAAIDACGGLATFETNRRARYAQAIMDAENGMFDESLPESDRLFYQSAITKAKRAIESGSQDAYIEAALTAATTTPDAQKVGNEDAWASVVERSANNGPESKAMA